MASPFGHSLAGYAVYKFARLPETERSPRLMLLSIFMANFPDLDFLPGLMVGRPALYHQGVSHSLGIGLLVSLAAAGICTRRLSLFMPVFFLCFSAYASHLVLDFFGPDGRPPYGIPLFWPLSGEYFISHRPLFLGMNHAGSSDASIIEWILGILQPRNLRAMVVEGAWLAPLVILSHASVRNRFRRLRS